MSRAARDSDDDARGGNVDAGILSSLLKSGADLALQPLAVLPVALRRPVALAARAALDFTATMPLVTLQALRQASEALDRLSSRGADREDLGSRRRRESG